MSHGALHLPGGGLRGIGVDTSSDGLVTDEARVGSGSNRRRGIRCGRAALLDNCLADISVSFEDFLSRYFCVSVE